MAGSILLTKEKRMRRTDEPLVAAFGLFEIRGYSELMGNDHSRVSLYLAILGMRFGIKFPEVSV